MEWNAHRGLQSISQSVTSDKSRTAQPQPLPSSSKQHASDGTSNRELIAHQMKTIVFSSVSRCVLCDRKCLHYSNYLPGINFGITLPSLYRKYFSAGLISLYIVVYNTLHQKIRKGINFAIHYIAVTLRIVFRI